MKTTRRGFLGMLGSAVAGWFLPKKAEATTQEIDDNAVLESLASVVEQTNETIARWESEILYGVPGGQMPEGVITKNGDIPCRIFNSNDDMNLIGKVFLDGQDVTSWCGEFWGTEQPGEMQGWADLFEHDADGNILAGLGPTYDPVITRHCGVIRWEIGEFAYIECGRCKKEFRTDHAEFCWYCGGWMCADCWDEYGHCGHKEAADFWEHIKDRYISKDEFRALDYDFKKWAFIRNKPESMPLSEKKQAWLDYISEYETQASALDDFVRAAVRNNEIAMEQYEAMSNFGESYRVAMLEYADAIGCEASELTAAQKQQALLNHILEQDA